MRRRSEPHFDRFRRIVSMRTMKILIPVVAASLLAGHAAAQTQEADEVRREAERQLEEAARRIAELSQQNLPRVVEIERSVVERMGRPRLGVTVGGNEGK